MSSHVHAFNLCDVPPLALGSVHFNREPRPLRIQGVEAAHRTLFSRLAPESDPVRRADLLHDYMDVTFQLHHWRQETSASGRRSLKNTYMRFLRGWMVDANSTAGAVLKGWVESRMGLIPTFHRGPIADLHDDAYETYLIDRMNGHACTNAILAQFDVLFHFVQYELHRRAPDVTHRTLYRGIHDLAEHEILGRSGEELVRMRLNNLNSFTSDFERAWEFGTRVLEAQVPVAKIFFQADILPSSILKGEEEVLVIGGEFDVKVRTH